MKPNFALKLSNDGIELLHRASGGWLSVGTLDFASEDVAQGCARLVAEAKRLEPDGIRTKLVLPESETRFTSVVAPGPTDEARRYQIEAEIEALTPYSVDELAYDWSVEGDYALVAVCARETLAEAEAFADGYGFNPVSFVAAHDGGPFTGEPFFGQTSVAAAYLPAGATVQRDVEPVRVTGKAARPQERPAPAAPTETPEAAPAETPKPAAPAADAMPPRVARPEAAKPAPAGPARMPAPAPGAAARPVAAPPAAGGDSAAKAPPPRRSGPALPSLPAEPLARVGGLVRRMGTRLRREQAQDAARQATPVERPAAPSPAPAGAAGGQTQPRRPEAAQKPTIAPVAPVVTPVSAPRSTPTPAPADDGAVSFSSRRPAAPGVAAGRPAEPAAKGADSAARRTSPGGRIAMIPGAGAASGAAATGFAAGMLDRGRGFLRGSLSAVGLGAGRADRPARRRAAGPEPIVPASRPPASEREKATEAEALTIFGARGNQSKGSMLGGTALIATGAVLLLVVAVAVWALYFRGVETPTQLAGRDGDNGTQLAAPEADPIRAPAALETPVEDDTRLAGLTAPEGQPDAAATPIADPAQPGDAAAMPGLEAPGEAADADPGAVADAGEPAPAPQTAETPGEGVSDPDQLLEALVQEALNEALPDVTPGAAAEQAQAAGQPEGAGDTPAAGQEAGTLVATRAGGGTATDTPQVSGSGTARRRLSLPSGFDVPPVQETGFASPPPPPPPGTNFDFDDRGLVEATPDGALTPSGVTVFARRPDVVPAPRPLAAIPSEALPPDFPRADPALADARPRARSAAIDEAVRQFREAQGAQPDATPDAAPQEPGDGQQDAALRPAAPGDDPGAPQTQTAALDAPDAPPPGGVSLAALRPGGEDLRPQRRPTDLVPPQAPDGANAPQVEPGLVESEDAPGIDLSGATEEAVAASLQPRDRPSGVAERAQAAMAEVAAAAAERSERQAEIREAQPAIPTSASVARQATQTDAIRLNRVNLIAVFGTATNRRALVRLGSGRVVRVQVGDRLDGGQVTAIGQSELRYVKNGRNEILEIEG